MLLTTLNCGLITVFVFLCLVGCDSRRMERDFFRQSPETGLVRFRQYSLDDQYKIFRYGNDVVEPPVLGLANPIAERGPEVVPFLLAKLNSERDDISIRDIMFIFSVMAASKTYDVKSDGPLMTRLDAAVSGMTDKDWRNTCVAMLKRIKESSYS